MIDVEALVFRYPSGPALSGVGFVARTGSVVGLVGPAGSGKSTLLRCIATLETPESGRIVAAGVDVERDPRAAHAVIGYLPAAFGLYDALTVGQCLLYAARSRGVAQARAPEAAAEIAAAVGLEARTPTFAGALEPGERQRLGLAQALVHRPRVLLLDQPDESARPVLEALLPDLARRGVTVMVSAVRPGQLPNGCTDLLELEDGQVVNGGLRRLQFHVAGALA